MKKKNDDLFLIITFCTRINERKKNELNGWTNRGKEFSPVKSAPVSEKI